VAAAVKDARHRRLCCAVAVAGIDDKKLAAASTLLPLAVIGHVDDVGIGIGIGTGGHLGAGSFASSLPSFRWPVDRSPLPATFKAIRASRSSPAEPLPPLCRPPASRGRAATSTADRTQDPGVAAGIDAAPGDATGLIADRDTGDTEASKPGCRV
jgi:hypothetical protein